MEVRWVMLLLVTVGMAVGKSCPKDRVDKRQFYRWTKLTKEAGKVRPVANARCWWDLLRTDCGRCKNGGKQCGAPMHK